MADKVTRYLALSQISLFSCLAICTIITPGLLFERNEGGVSNFGVHRATVVPYTLAFLLCGLFVLRAARDLPRTTKSFSHLRYGLYALAAVLFINLTTTYPYKSSQTLNNLHVTAAIIAFWVEMAMGVWLALALYRDRLSILLLALQAAGFFAAFLTFIGAVHLLFITQIVTALAFGGLLVHGVSRSINNSKLW